MDVGPKINTNNLLFTVDSMNTKSYNNDFIYYDLVNNIECNLVRTTSKLNTTSPTAFGGGPEFVTFDNLSSTSLHIVKSNNTNSGYIGFNLAGKTAKTGSYWRVKCDLVISTSNYIRLYMGASNGGYSEGPQKTYYNGTHSIDEIFYVSDGYTTHEEYQLQFSLRTFGANDEITMTNLDIREVGPQLNNSTKLLDFNGTTNYIDAPFITGTHFIDNQSFTIETIISFPVAPTTKGGIVGNQLYKSEADAGGFGLTYFSDSKYYMILTDKADSSSYENICPMTITTGKTEHIIYTYNSTTHTVIAYRNGVVINTSTNTNYRWDTSSRNTRIGSSEQGGWALYNEMNIGLVRVYGDVLSPDEVGINYNAIKKRLVLS